MIRTCFIFVSLRVTMHILITGRISGIAADMTSDDSDSWALPRALTLLLVKFTVSCRISRWSPWDMNLCNLQMVRHSNWSWSQIFGIHMGAPVFFSIPKHADVSPLEMFHCPDSGSAS